MIRFANAWAMIVGAVSVLSATSQPGFADPNRYIPVLEQRAAILDCRYEMGLRGAARFGAEWPETPPGGQTVTWILPGPNLTPAQTDRINECADERLGRAKTPRFTSGQTSERFEYRRCPPGAPVILGGTTYCIKRR